MDMQAILSHVDHTNLRPTATWDEIEQTLNEAMEFGATTACIPPCHLVAAKDHVSDKLTLCTVVGFPLGYCSTYVKVFEAMNAVQNGADEIDMVINLGDVKAGEFKKVLLEIASVKRAIGDSVLKVIIEATALTLEEKITLCKIVFDGGGQYIKTSTGFGNGGATKDDVRLLKAYVPDGLLIKASGGISNFEEARAFLSLGASRLGTSKLVLLAKQLKMDELKRQLSKE